MATVKTSEPRAYTVRLTPQGEQYVREQRLAAKLAVAAAKLEQAERTADTWARGARSCLQRERGMCSDPDCDEPIAGWCDTCDAGGPFKAPKWCEAHMRAHLAAHRGHMPYRRYSNHDGHDGGAA